MIRLTVSNEEYLNDLAELVRPFESRSDKDVSIDVGYLNDGRNIRICIKSDAFDGFEKRYAFTVVAKDELERKRIEKRHLKVAIYRTLSFITGVNLPYGCLTGIRPTKLFLEIENEFEKYGKSACEVFEDDYSVSENKVKLVKRIVDVQRPLRNKSQNEYDVFVFIPFCPTRCAYCSFVSLPIDKQIKLVRPYVDCLLRELEQTKELIRSRKIKVRAVYVGGGTPTSIGAELLDEVLAACHFGASEFTVEAGRPDTIDKDVASVLKKHGVTRVSVNPQTFNDKTLEVIGRRHKCADTYNAYMLVKDDFDVNMDLIACLPGETFDDFKRSVDIAVALNPANVTVHTLYMKKGSALKQCGYDNTDYDTASRMVDYAYSRLTQAGYEPYYMYRQKYTSGNLENVGYAKPGKACLYNVDIMEEDTSILANGANGISKKWDKDKNLITRCANYKEPLEYVKHIDEMLKRQRDFWN